MKGPRELQLFLVVASSACVVVLHIEAAFRTSQENAAVAWTSYDGKNHSEAFEPENAVHSEIEEMVSSEPTG